MLEKETFAYRFNQLMNDRLMDVKTLAQASGISEPTLYGYSEGKHSPGNYMIVIAICIGMRLDFRDSTELLLSAGFKVDYSKLTHEQQVHYSALMATHIWSLDEWNMYFKRHSARALVTNPNSKNGEPE
jgi:DNA-binding Xre family transcriptional regulator